MDCTVWNERHSTRLACRRPGAGAHRDIERGKVPGAAEVACIARSACTLMNVWPIRRYCNCASIVPGVFTAMLVDRKARGSSQSSYLLPVERGAVFS